jgi:hypothetical protein
MSKNLSAAPIERLTALIEAAPGNDPDSLVREALDDIALVIGGAAAIHGLDDDLIWSVMKRLDRIRVRLLRDLKGLAPRDESEPNPARPPRVHAAVEEFLVRNRMAMGE